MDKIPNITASDIQRLIKRDFSEIEFNAVEKLLELYNSGEGNRVRASILKLSDGDIALVKKYVDRANYDYRDILGPAEYPNYWKREFGEDLTKKIKNQIINLDWAQYQAWRNKA